MSASFRDSASFGKRMEYKLLGDMLLAGLDCYVPLVDDHGVDCVIKRRDGSFIEVQIKASSRRVKPGDAALFAAIRHEPRENFFFVFCSERMGKMWIMSSAEFLAGCSANSRGKNAGQRSIKLNGWRRRSGEEYPLPRFAQYLADDFSRLC